MSEQDQSTPFARRTVIFGIAASLIAAMLFFILASYAPKLPGDVGVTATPASDSAVGYSGFLRLMEQAGPRVRVLNRVDELRAEGLAIIFIDATDSVEAVEQIAAARRDEPTLFVLPKWAVQPVGFSSNRVQSIGTYPVGHLDGFLNVIAPGLLGETDGAGRASVAGVAVTLPTKLHLAEGERDALNRYPAGLLVEAQDRPHWVLTDPDMINNAGIDDLAYARAMFAMIDDLRYTGDDVLIATPRLASPSGRNLGKLLFDPPFLPLTIILLFAGLLALLHGFARFGPVRRRGRVFAFGKAALVGTTADLVARAGKVAGLGPRYAETMRRRAGERMGAPPSLSGKRLDAWLDQRAGRASNGSAQESAPFTRRAEAVSGARNEEELHRNAHALAAWIEGKR